MSRDGPGGGGSLATINGTWHIERSGARADPLALRRAKPGGFAILYRAGDRIG